MDLFSTETIINLLPYGGEVSYYGRVVAPAEANHYRDKLLTDIAWKNDEAIIFGKHIITRRKVAWYGDANYSYAYSGTTRHALPWTQELLELKALVERYTDTIYNSCLLNLYHNGDEGMAWPGTATMSGRSARIAPLLRSAWALNASSRSNTAKPNRAYH